MKNILNGRFYKQFLYTLLLCTLAGSVYGMKRTLETPSETIYSLPKTTENKPHHIEKMKNIWIKTSDDQLITMPEWQIDHIKVLHLLLVNQKGTNSEKNPIDASRLQKNNGQVVDTSAYVLNLIKIALEVSNDLQELAVFIASFSMAQNEHQYQKDQENLKVLINTAADLEANALFASLASASLMPEMQQKIGLHLLAPVIEYFINNLTVRFQYPHQLIPEGANPLLSDIQIKISPKGRYLLSTDPYNNHKTLNWDLTPVHGIIQHRLLNGVINTHIDNLQFSSTDAYLIKHENNNCAIIDYASVVSDAQPNRFDIYNSICTTFSPDDMHCLYSTLNEPGTINLISRNNAQNWIQMPALKKHVAQVNTIKFSPDGNYIVSGSNDNFPNNLILWDGKTFEKITSFDYHGSTWTTHIFPVIQIDFTSDSKYIISKDTSNNIIIWDVHSREPVAKFDNHNNALWRKTHPKPMIFPNPVNVSYNPKKLHHYGNSSNERKLYEYGINNFFGHSFLPINTNALSRLIIEPTKIIGQRFSSKKMVTISPNKNYNIQYAVESSNSQFLAFSYLPKYIKFNFYDTNTSLNIPTESCTSIQFSPHNNYIVITHPAANKYMFSLWNIVHLDIIRDVVNGFITLSQSRFLYRLFLGKLNKVNIVIDQNDPDYMVYLSLPEVLKILVDRFLPFNLTSDLAQKDLKETH